MDTIEILRRARDGWSDESRRCVGAFAKNETGDSVGAFCPSACRWCAIGWLRKVSPCDTGMYPAVKALGLELPCTLPIANDSGYLTIEHWNKAIRSLGGEP